MVQKIFKGVYIIFLLAVGTIAVLLLFSAVPIAGNYKLMIVQSGSMEPAIKTGSIVVVKPAKEYQVGDIVTFGSEKDKKKTVTHRIAERKENSEQISFVTKGDANDGNDSRELPASEILGKVLFSVPYAGYAVATAKTPYGFFGLVIIPAIIIIFEEARKIFVEIRRIRKKKLEIL